MKTQKSNPAACNPRDYINFESTAARRARREHFELQAARRDANAAALAINIWLTARKNESETSRAAAANIESVKAYAAIAKRAARRAHNTRNLAQAQKFARAAVRAYDNAQIVTLFCIEECIIAFDSNGVMQLSRLYL